MLPLGRQNLYRTHFPSYICSNRVSSSSTSFCRVSGSFSRGNSSLVEGFGPRWTMSLEFLLPDMSAKSGHGELRLSRTLESQSRVPNKYTAHAERADSSDAPRVFPPRLAIAAVPRASRASSPSRPVDSIIK